MNPTRRSIAELLAPLEKITARLPQFTNNGGAIFTRDRAEYELPRYVFIGPGGGGDPMPIGIFATIHGDEAEGAHGLNKFINHLSQNPNLAEGYVLYLYPICNPTGYEDTTRQARNGPDLNRHFWKNSTEPEVQILERELTAHHFQGLIALHCDDTSEGMYGFVRGATLTKDLLSPALRAAAEILPTNLGAIIDGFAAREGLIHDTGYEGMLTAPPNYRPKPFEITLETPHRAPLELQSAAFARALEIILTEYRKVISYAADL